MIDHIDSTLTAFLADALPEVILDFNPPTRDWRDSLPSNEITLSCYLYDVREASDSQEQWWQAQPRDDHSVSLSRAPHMMELSYLLSVWAEDDVAKEHRALGRVVTTFSSSQRIPDEFVTDDAQVEPGYPLVGMGYPLELTSPIALWSAFGIAPRPAYPLRIITPFPIEPAPADSLVVSRRVDFQTHRAPTATLGGWVRSEDGAPVSGATVRVHSENKGQYNSETDSTGRFRVTSPAEGEVSVEVQAVGYTTKSTVVSHVEDIGRDNLELLLDKAGG